MARRQLTAHFGKYAILFGLSTSLLGVVSGVQKIVHDRADREL